jgi:alkanesulfonate monooxygenase SsuD/methylene tetrahydromethanopterin reductase-like flavin-dependent oxidoreductase (luciferase family)
VLTYGALLPARPQYLDHIPDLEAAGYHDAWFPDFQLAGGDPFVTMALQASRTTKLEFSVCVCNPVTRHVTVVANLMATLNREFPGRVGLGVGVGASPLKAVGLPQAKLADLERFVVSCRALMAGEEAVLSQGTAPVRFLQFWRDALNTEMHVPIRVAAGGPRSLRLAGMIADEVVIGTIDPTLLALQIDLVRAGARAAGRSEDEVGIAVLAAAYSADEDPSLATLREHVGGYVPNMLVSNGGCIVGNEKLLDPVLVEAFSRIGPAQTRAVQAAERSAGGRRSAVFESYMEAIPEEYDALVNMTTLGAKAFFGPREEVRRRLKELAALGVTKVVLFQDPKDPASLGTFAHHYIDLGASCAD